MSGQRIYKIFQEKKKFSEKKRGKGKIEDLITQSGDIKTWYDENKTHLELINRYPSFMSSCGLEEKREEFKNDISKLIKSIQKNLKHIFEKK